MVLRRRRTRLSIHRWHAVALTSATCELTTVMRFAHHSVTFSNAVFILFYAVIIPEYDYGGDLLKF